MEEKFHIPVMRKEALDCLNLRPGLTVVDATLGNAGHALEMLKAITPAGTLIGIDKDEDALVVARKRLKDFEGRFNLVRGDFRNMDKILDSLNINKVDAILFDLGISSFQMEDAQRGFSFRSEGPLDMRMDRDSYISAYDLVNNLNEDELSSILKTFGEERWHKRIAHIIVEERNRAPISTTKQLSDLAVRAIPQGFRHGRIHAATRTFQAIRIAVNRELEALKEGLSKAVSCLARGGRICVISFHSLEDRIVKHEFKRLAVSEVLRLNFPKPLVPGMDEIMANPLSRSAKLRCAERIS